MPPYFYLRSELNMRILFIGDIVGSQGRHMLQDNLTRLIEEKHVDFVIANGENASGGFGLSQRSLRELADCGIDAFTMGNHTWDCKEIYNYIENERRLIRPANLPPGTPGKGWRDFSVGGQRLVVANVLGRTFMTPFDCPFRAMDEMLKTVSRKDAVILVDFHAETTSEKMAMGWYLDGRVSAVVGTHTHIQTNDARILPKGTGYLTDAGMTGPRDSILGVEKETIIERYLTGVSSRFEVASGDLQLNAVIFQTGEDNAAEAVELVNFWQPSL